MNKIGLALSGGAFCGMAHIGVLQVLDEHKIPIHCIAGTSMGALIGGVYACGTDPKLIARLAENLNMRDYYDVVIPREGFIKGDRVLTLLRTMTGNKDFTQLKIPFQAIATDIETGERVEIKQGKICDGIRASISLPGIFVPYRIGDRTFCDGGLVDRIPTSSVYDMGADIVIAVDVGYKGYKKKPNGILEILLHSFNIMDWEHTKHRDHHPDFLIAPNLQHIDYSSLRDMQECIELGRIECEQQIPQILEALAKHQEPLQNTPAKIAKPAPKPRAKKKTIAVEQE